MDEYDINIIKHDFGDSDFELVVAELESVTLSHVMTNSESQLDHARKIILRESKGDLDKLGKLVALAKRDIRDILVRARPS